MPLSFCAIYAGFDLQLAAVGLKHMQNEQRPFSSIGRLLGSIQTGQMRFVFNLADGA